MIENSFYRYPHPHPPPLALASVWLATFLVINLSWCTSPAACGRLLSGPLQWPAASSLSDHLPGIPGQWLVCSQIWSLPDWDGQHASVLRILWKCSCLAYQATTGIWYGTQPPAKAEIGAPYLCLEAWKTTLLAYATQPNLSAKYFTMCYVSKT